MTLSNYPDDTGLCVTGLTLGPPVPTRRLTDTRADDHRPAARTVAALEPGASRQPWAWCVLQLAFRAWATYSSWFTYDDFLFISRMTNDGPAPHDVEPYAGHVMPAGCTSPGSPTGRAVRLPGHRRRCCCSCRCSRTSALVVLLVRLFGTRGRDPAPAGALPVLRHLGPGRRSGGRPGVNQLPLQVALFWGLACARVLPAARAGRGTLVAAVALAGWSGCSSTRRPSWSSARWASWRSRTSPRAGAGSGCGGVAALPVRRPWSTSPSGWPTWSPTSILALNFSPGKRQQRRARRGRRRTWCSRPYVPAVVGGPLRWTAIDQFSLAEPGQRVVSWPCLAVIGLLVSGDAPGPARDSLRAWWLPVFFLACDVLLVVGRPGILRRALIGLDYRYQGELAAVTALALALRHACPIIGAPWRPVEPRPASSALLDHPRRVAARDRGGAALALVSSTQYVWHWQTTCPAKPYFDHLLGDARSRRRSRSRSSTTPVPALHHVGRSATRRTCSATCCVDYADRTDFVDVATDHAEHGRRPTASVVPAAGHRGPTARSPGPRAGLRLRGRAATTVTIPLDGPVAFGGWWVRIGYLASAPAPSWSRPGDASYSHRDPSPACTRSTSTAAPSSTPSRSRAWRRVSPLCTDDVVGRRTRATPPRTETP